MSVMHVVEINNYHVIAFYFEDDGSTIDSCYACGAWNIIHTQKNTSLFVLFAYNCSDLRSSNSPEDKKFESSSFKFPVKGINFGKHKQLRKFQFLYYNKACLCVQLPALDTLNESNQLTILQYSVVNSQSDLD